MISFERPLALLLALPWLAFMLWFLRVQRRALDWVDERLSPRFRSTVTRYSGAGLWAHLGLLSAMGLLAVFAAAGPSWLGRGNAVAEEGRLLLLIDASSSMRAEDVEPLEADAPALRNRLELARAVAFEVADGLDGWQLGLISFSGVSTLHLPLTTDRVVLHDAIRTLEEHSFYQNTGSNFLGALDAAIPFVEPRRPDLQILVLSDGEMPREQELDTPLQALRNQGVPVHALAIGSLEGQSRNIFDFRDVVAGKEEKRVLREFHTRREDRHLRRMAETTGGFFQVASPGVLEELLHALRARQAEGTSLRDPEARTDLASWLLGSLLLLFLAETLWVGHGAPEGAPVFDLQRLGRPSGLGLSLLLPLLLLGDSGCRGPVYEAHRENEFGIGSDEVGQHPAARIRYERSAAFGVDPEVPTYNRARSLVLSREWSEAHRVFQEALVLQPELARAHYNDGVALFRWGEDERDPNDCHLERTRDLWQQSLRRFAGAGALLAPDSELSRDARDNHRAIRVELAEVEKLITDPPPECLQKGGGEEPKPEGEGGGGGAAPSGSAGDQPENPKAELPPEGGAGPDPPLLPEGGAGSTPPSGGGGASLGSDQLEQVKAELERIRGQGREEGKFHRRTLPEQFGPEVWKHPEKVIWW